ncbi:hypothetical protein UFOVP326_100 [uncultured Caudovirales phage]|uniref:Uncharacterized protein n=1 Tax=uncultured Caudovirales phage TaxID=2100421 RepID=A0A6J5M1G6_9CAUD|nr:hypothetical protein UFOVP326_100 [uncultured Caudovirales phage]
MTLASRRSPPPADPATPEPTIRGPGAKAKRGEDHQLDDVRRMILDRIHDRGLTITDLSRALSRNEAYMHQYIWRQSPAYLRERDRAVVAKLLGIPEDVLREPAHSGPMPAIIARATLDAPVQSSARDVPVYHEAGDIDPSAPLDWTHRPPSLAGGGPVFAVWIAQPHGRLSPGDLAYVRQHQPPRIGDLVVAIAGSRIAAIGDLVELTATRAAIQVAPGKRESVAPPAEVRKVVAITLA